VIRDALERVADIVAANFAVDLAALATAKGVTIDTTATIYKRRSKETFGTKRNPTLPGIGIFWLSGATNARRQDERDTTLTMVLDYYALDTDPDRLAEQVELAVEALLRSVDRLGEGAAGVLGAGEPENSIQLQHTPTSVLEGAETYEERAQVLFPIIDQDVGLS
jgi:hypothetical protein